MDEALVRSFLLALHTTVEDPSLPMLVSTLSAQHVMPAFRRLTQAPDELNIKQTKWKKLGEFLADMAAQGMFGKPQKFG